MSENILSIHENWMAEAIRLAELAYRNGEIPIGAIVIKDRKIIGRGYNQREKLKDPTAHAEIIAISAAANTLGDWRLNDCTLYVTKEPCAMCTGALVNARISSIVFGCYDADNGYCGSVADLCNSPQKKNTVSIRGGINEKRCLDLVQNFFKNRRKA